MVTWYVIDTGFVSYGNEISEGFLKIRCCTEASGLFSVVHLYNYFQLYMKGLVENR